MNISLFFYYKLESNSIAASSLTSQSTGGAKKVNVEVIMKSNPFRVGKAHNIRYL